MANRGCANIGVELDESKYSSPMPFIGLYIAAGSLLCLLAMLFDISSALRHKTRWLPCRFFRLDSVTLTLLAIAAKLPVDLTASMPSTLEQFSKLSGMAFICISMGFLMPSLGMNQKSEGKSNMIALSIMVVTVIVNICIQIRTRLILLFVTEHIIIIVCMLVLLWSLWGSLLVGASDKNYELDHSKGILKKGTGSMLELLKLSYLHGFDNNPQLSLCKNVGVCVVAGICMICSGVLIQAAVRNLSVDFCNGQSDYGWSMWVIVAVQTLTVIVGSVAIVFRWVAMSVRIKLRRTSPSMAAQARNDIYRNYELVPSSKILYMYVLFTYITLLWGFLIHIVVYVPSMLVLKAARLIIDPCLKKNYKDDEDIKEYKHLVVKDGKGLEEWVVKKGVEDMKRWIKISQVYSPNHLLKLLSDTVPSQEVNTTYLQDLHVSSLSLALLARVAQVSLPKEAAAQSLVEAYGEAYEIIHFIEDKMVSKTFEYEYNTAIAKAIWRGNGFGHVLKGYLLEGIDETDPLRRSLWILTSLKASETWNGIETGDPNFKRWWPDSEYWKEVVLLVNFLLHSRSYSSTEDLSKKIQQVFVDMLHRILAQLPQAIYKAVLDSTAENFDQRVRRSLAVLCQAELLQHSIRWSYPVEGYMSQLWPGQPQEPLQGRAHKFLSLAFG